ncbi:Pyruvate decarboxylase 1 [Spatholobus suberectus]|nr:Pyruvate decarboxylase 1 [Spatholobus suberectus]
MDTKIGSLDAAKPASNDVVSCNQTSSAAIQPCVPATAVSGAGEATLGRHLARRLVQIGVTDVFSVPGDFNLTLLDHLIAEPALNVVGCCNELNAGYAADGYARARGVGACVVTFTVGGLSVLNAIAGAYSENLPLICIVGGPNSNDYGTSRILHHTIGLPDFSKSLGAFRPLLASRLSNKMGLEAAVEAAAEFLNKAVKPVLVGGPKLRVAAASDAFVELADACEKRVIACIGDGSFQVTAQDVSTMLRNGQKSIIFLINNGGYTIEVEIHDGPYNVIKNWNYTGLVDAIHNGEGKCWTAKVFCEEELVEAIAAATGPQKDSFCFIEVIVHKDDTSKELLEWGSRVSAANSRPPNPQ